MFKQSIKALGKSVLAGLRASRAELSFYRQLHQPVNEQFPFAFKVDGDYLISTDQGVFRLHGNTLQKLTTTPAFGIAISPSPALTPSRRLKPSATSPAGRGEPVLYLASWNDAASIVVKGSLRALLDGQPNFEPIHMIPVLNSGMRIHQICIGPNGLWLANTARNALTKLDRHSGHWLAEIAPVADSFGAPITTDHSHINSITAYEKVLLFVAFKIGKQAMLGVVGQGKVRGYAYRNMGVHDIHITGDKLIFSDSYRFNDKSESGALIINGEIFDPGFFAEHPQPFVRGVAGVGDELLIGNSFWGSREERFSGKGTLMIAKGQSIVFHAPFPAAQIYDILRTDGTHFDVPAQITDFDAICQLFRQQFGDPVLEMPLAEAAVSEKGKKYDQRDWGQLDELV